MSSRPSPPSVSSSSSSRSSRESSSGGSTGIASSSSAPKSPARARAFGIQSSWSRREPCPRGDELADDDVLLETKEPVLLAHDRGLGEDARRLLEGRRREEA